MRSYAYSIIAAIAIAVPALSTYAQDDPRLSGAAQMAAKRAKQGITPHVDKTHNGGLFGAFAYFKGVIPDDVYSLEDVGVRCNESGTPDEHSPSRCKRYVSDSKNTTFVIRFSPNQDRAFFYKKVGDQKVLVPYVTFTNSTNEMVYASDEGRQFASAHGLGIETTVASTSPPEVVPTATKCDNLFEPLKGACLGVLAADKKPVTIGPAVIGGIIKATK